MKNYIGAIDLGTTSTRFMVFDRPACIAAVGQKEHGQIYPGPGWVEHDPLESCAERKNRGRSGELARTRKLK